MSFTNTKYDNCALNQQESTNKSIFSYVVDPNYFVNQRKCFDVTPPFLSYIPMGIPKQNVDIENDLRGINRVNTKCTSCKYQPNDNNLIQTVDSQPVYNLKTCTHDNQIRPQGYFQPQ